MRKVLVFQHIQREHPSLIAEYAKEKGVGLDLVKIWERQAIPDVSNYDALVVLGGPMGVYDEYAGKDEEVAAIKNAIEKIPVLGICLGAQLIAHALGARVYPYVKDGTHIKEVGYYDVDATADGMRCRLFAGLPEKMKVLQWHGDTFDMPEGARLTATDAICENQAFCRKNVHGLQFHVEATPELVDEWLAEDSAWASTGFELDAARIREEARSYAPILREECYRILDNLLIA